MARLNAFTAYGSAGKAYVYHVEDARGDLVDIEYQCPDCYRDDTLPTTDDWAAPLHWPAYDWPDYDVHCTTCGELLNKGR